MSKIAQIRLERISRTLGCKAARKAARKANRKAERKADRKGKVYTPAGTSYLGLTALSRRSLKKGSRLLADIQAEIQAEIAMWTACADTPV